MLKYIKYQPTPITTDTGKYRPIPNTGIGLTLFSTVLHTVIMGLVESNGTHYQVYG